MPALIVWFCEVILDSDLLTLTFLLLRVPAYDSAVAEFIFPAAVVDVPH